jgi:hypothetical protein
MFLVRYRTAVSSEGGSAIVAVIGIAAAMMIIGVTVASMSVHALAFTSSTRAGIQSEAAAESGINVAVVDLRNGNCSATYSQTTAPAYSAKVSYSTSTTGDVWVANTCPPYADQTVKRVKILSTGSATSTGVAGDASGNSGFVEAIYPYTPAVIPGVQPSGAAMYFYGGVAFANNGNLIVSAGGPPAIQVKSGDVSCANNTVIQGDVVVQNGNLSISSCTIQGNAWVSGTATLGTVTANLTAANTTRPSGVGGTYTTNGPIPAVPNWVPFGYVPANWVDSSGNPYKVISIGADCALTPTMMNAIAATGTTPVILDAMSCAAGITASATVALPNDLVIFSPTFNLSGSNNLRITSSSSTQHRKVWFITPDVTLTNPPTCDYSKQGDFTIKNSFTIDATVAAMLYTPCQFVTKNTFTWNGQIYANGSSNAFKNNTAFTYVGLGLPGVDLGNGTVTHGGSSSGSPATLKSITSIRDVNSGG